jgi:aryl-phospho-beta-D-glucosidase BglC (GH1 family)
MRFRLCATILFWFELCSLVLWLQTATAETNSQPSFLSARGQDIVNEKGEKVLLRGVGLGNWMLPEGYMWKFENADRPRRIEKLVLDLTDPEYAERFWTEFRASYITEADIRRIAELGFNSVRPALNARLFMSETDPPQRVEEGYQLLDHLVRWCKTYGLYVIIDMHAAPGGQTGQNIDDSANDQPELFQQQKYQDRLVDLWVDLAKRYKDEPTVAGYDLLNEPLPQRTGAAPKYKHLVEPLYKRVTKAIREVDQRHMIVLEGVDWANDWSIFTERFDANVVYQFHYYCWDTPAQLKSIDRYLEHRQRLNAPVWVGETGERDSTIYWATTEYFEARNIGWSFWPWKKMDTANTPYSIKRPAGWDAVAAYSRGRTKPARETAQRTLDEFLRNIRLENCAYYPDVVNAMLRRAPVRIEAENYGQAGPGISYQVNQPTNRSHYYRLETAVPVKIHTTQRPRTDQFIVLTTNEWTSYQIECDAARITTLILSVRAEVTPAQAQLRINDQIVSVPVTTKSWTEIKLTTLPLQQGSNQIKWTVQRGTIELDWIDVRFADEARPVKTE